MFRHMEHEIDETEDADSWKLGLDDAVDDDEPDEDEDDEDKDRHGPYTP
jgi:hypothetical protein